MSPTLTQAFSNFLQSLTGIGISLFNSGLAVFQAILALFQGLLQNIIQLAHAFITLGLDVFQGVLGFVTANFVILGVLGGGYYWYTNRQQGGRRSSRIAK